MNSNISIYTVDLITRRCACNKINYTFPDYVQSKCRMQVCAYLSLRTVQEMREVNVQLR